MNVYQALAQPRMHDQLVPATVSFEWAGTGTGGYDNATVAYLKGLG
jgi:gamma-glutamyltranspeptidase/glutathione hydrolase